MLASRLIIFYVNFFIYLKNRDREELKVGSICFESRNTVAADFHRIACHRFSPSEYTLQWLSPGLNRGLSFQTGQNYAKK